MSQESHPSYSISGFEGVINAIIKFIFYYRMVLVVGTLVALGFITNHIWNVSAVGEQWKTFQLCSG